MSCFVDIKHETFPLAKAFSISRGSKTEAEVVTVEIRSNGQCGRGECVPYARYGETIGSVTAQIQSITPQLESGMDRLKLQTALPAGAARNAVDCALWDLEAKESRTSVAKMLKLSPLQGVETAYTISLDTPEEMAHAAHVAAHHPILKIKLGGEGDIDRVRAVHAAAPDSTLIVDANEAWTPDTVVENMLACAEAHVALIEQPLPDGEDAILAEIPHPVPICADESVHTGAQLAELGDRYDFVNIKLDKAGGLTEAMNMMEISRRLGFGVMVGCMVGSSLAMAPAMIPAQLAAFVDLDAPLLLSRDRPHALHYSNSVLAPPSAQLWG